MRSTRKLTIADAMKIAIRNPAENASGGIDCEIEHPRLGWIKYSAAANGDPAMQRIYTRASAMGPKPYVPPPLTDQQITEQARREREIAFRREADPIFFQVQRGEMDRQAWLDKCAEIKARFPYPQKG